jgi:hypothetical protein
LLNCFALAHEFFLIPFLSVIAIALYLLIFRVDLLIYLMAFVTPFSIDVINAFNSCRNNNGFAYYALFHTIAL